MDTTGGPSSDLPSASTLLQTLQVAVSVQKQLADDSARQTQRISWLHCALEQILKERPLSEQHGSWKWLVMSEPSNTRNNHQETLHTTTLGMMQVCQTHMPDRQAASSTDVLTATSCCDGNLHMDAGVPHDKADAMVATRLAVACRQLPETPAVTTRAVMAIHGRASSIGRSSSSASSITNSDNFTQAKVATKGDLAKADSVIITENLQFKSCIANHATAIKQFWPRGPNVDAKGMQRDECHLDCVANNCESDRMTSVGSPAAIAPAMSFGPQITEGCSGVTTLMSCVGSTSSGPPGSDSGFSSVPKCKAVARIDPNNFGSERSLMSTVSAPCTKAVTSLDEASILKSFRETLPASQGPSNTSAIKEASGLQQNLASKSPDPPPVRSSSLPLPNKHASAGNKAHRRGACGTVARRPKKDMASLERQLAHQLWQDMGMIPEEEEIHSGQRHTMRRNSKRQFWRLSGRPALLHPSTRVQPDVLPSGTNEQIPLDGDEFVENAEELGNSGHLLMPKDDATGAAESLVEPPVDPAGTSTNLAVAASHAPPPFLAGSQISSTCSQLAVIPQQVASKQRKVPSMSHVRDVHQQNLIKEMCGELKEPAMIIDDYDNSCCCTSKCSWNCIQNIIFCSCGVLPWSSTEYPLISWLYQCFMLLVVFVVTFIHCMDLPMKNGDDIMSLELSIDIVLAMGCAFSLAACGALWKSTLIVEACGLLRTYTTKYALWSQVRDSCQWDMSMTLACWLTSLSVRVAVHNLVTTGTFAEAQSLANLALFTIVSGILTGLVAFSLYWCRCMMTMVDDFSMTMSKHQQFGSSLQDWNLLQSVHRNTCQAIQIPFMVMQTTAMVICILVIQEAIRPLEWERLLVTVPGLLVALAIFRICIYAGVLTDKCTRLPILISGLGLKNKNGEGLNLNWERLYAVSFISTNQAGFFIFEVRVTSAMVCKTAYVVAAVAFGLVSWQK